MDDSGYSGRLRKRKRVLGDGAEESLRRLLELTETCGKMVIFSGSGLSANSGMSMFTTKNGLYERARSKFKIQDGMKLFSYPFYKQRRKDLQAFFAQIYSEAQSSRAAPGHVAIAELHRMGRLQRHYTLNIDGLAAAVGMDTWHHENNPEGSTVEMHGNISYVVCPDCHAVEPLTGAVMETMKACQPVICKACNEEEMRFKVMLYDDEQGDCITPEDVFERLDDDLAVAGAVVWVGISFEQSASTEYFRKVRHMLASHGRLHEVTQVILNPSEEPYFNVISTMSNKEDVKVLDVRATSDDALPSMVQHLHQLGGTSPDSASMQAATAAATAAAASRRQRTLQQEEQQARAAQEEHLTPKAGGRRKRHSGSAMGSPVDCAGAAAATHSQPCAAEEAGSPSYAELASMDSAAAAALSLPAAVQKHFAQKQLQLQLQLGSSNGVHPGSSNGVKLEAENGVQAAPQQQSTPAAAAVASAAAGHPSGGLPLVPSSEQQLGGLQSSGFQQLLGQLQAVHALQAALAGTAQQQQPAAGVAGSEALAAASPLLAAAAAAGLQLPQTPAQLPGVGSVLAAVLAQQQAAAALQAAPCLSAPPLPTQQPVANSNPLAAAAALLASSPATASLLLSNPTMLAAVAAASAANGLGNGTTAAQPPSAAAVHMHNGAATGDASALPVQNGIQQPASPSAAEGVPLKVAKTSPPVQPMPADGAPAAVGVAAAAAAVPKAEPQAEPEEQ